MARKSVRGVCKLCRKRRILCKSHYLGRALYALSRVNGENPVVMTPQLVTLSPRQMWAHLLCRECEERFCKCGEKPVMQLLNGKDQFPLLNRMQLALAVKKDGDAVTFSGTAMGIDTTPLAYFALSLVWRGAVHKWKTLKGQQHSWNLANTKSQSEGTYSAKPVFPMACTFSLLHVRT